MESLISRPDPRWPPSATGANMRVQILTVYLAIGGLLGLLVEGSYLWAATFGAPQNLDAAARIYLFFTANYIGLASAILRTLFWLPSLLLWCLEPQTTFVLWLMPGGWTALQ